MTDIQAERDDVEALWDSFWLPLLSRDGVVDMGAVKRELFDWHTAIVEVGRAYCELTGDRVSKPNTRAEYVIDTNREMWEADIRERLSEARVQWEAEYDVIKAAADALVAFRRHVWECEECADGEPCPEYEELFGRCAIASDVYVAAQNAAGGTP